MTRQSKRTRKKKNERGDGKGESNDSPEIPDRRGQSKRTRKKKNERGDGKGESNDSPEIPDRRETSDTPSFPSGHLERDTILIACTWNGTPLLSCHYSAWFNLNVSKSL